MIVKNETKNLETLFESLHEVIDYYVIHDTGSTDGTPELIEKVMDNYGISGEIFHEEWKNFGYNRQKALESAYNSKFKPDYVFIIDADEEFYYADKDWFKNLTMDTYNIKRIYGSIEYYQPVILNVRNNNEIGWIWKAPVHNYLSSKNAKTVINVDKNMVHIVSHCHGGAKSQNVTSEQKYLRDAKLLLEYLEENPNDPRSLFYLAQSYKDASNPEEAIKWYKKRLTVKGWIQEKYMSCYNIGNLLRKIGKKEEALYYYLLSYEYDNSRYECFYEMIKIHRNNGNKKLAYSLYKQLKPFKNNSGKLFLTTSVHDWKLDYEVGIIAFYSRAYQDGIDAFKRLFKCKTIKKYAIASIFKNFGYYQKFIKDSDYAEVNKLKQQFIDFYFNPKKLIKQKISEQIKKEVEKELELKEETQGIKLTVTEKIN
tara:strand:+ start:2682 stop:3959 length:1278 start_codon:yes stop_codon:yes gene_type:complete